MELECLTSKLRAAVTTAERATGKNLSLPALSNIRLIATDRALKIEATNLELGIEVSVPARASAPGEVMVSGALFSGFLVNLPSSDEKIKLRGVEGNLVLETGSQSASISGFPTDDFPSIPQVEKASTFQIVARDLAVSLRAVGYSASSSNFKPEISSICLYKQEDGLYAVATDSYRLAEKQLSVGRDLPDDFSQIIIPLKSAHEIARILDQGEWEGGEVTVNYNDHQVSFSADNLYLTSRYSNKRRAICGWWRTPLGVES